MVRAQLLSGLHVLYCKHGTNLSPPCKLLRLDNNNNNNDGDDDGPPLPYNGHTEDLDLPTRLGVYRKYDDSDTIISDNRYCPSPIPTRIRIIATDHFPAQRLVNPTIPRGNK